MREAVDAAVERSREFDEDTSLGYEPERQKTWLHTVSEELEASER